MNVFMIMKVHTNVCSNYLCSICLCILICNCKHACHLLNVVSALSKENTRWNQWVWRRSEMYYQRKGPGRTGGCEEGVKCIIGGRDRVKPVGAKMGKNVYSGGRDRWIGGDRRRVLLLFLLKCAWHKLMLWFLLDQFKSMHE